MEDAPDPRRRRRTPWCGATRARAEHIIITYNDDTHVNGSSDDHPSASHYVRVMSNRIIHNIELMLGGFRVI